MTAVFNKDRLVTLSLWVLLLSIAWSLPVISYMRSEHERALVKAGHYYKPAFPAEFYVNQQPSSAVTPR
ncbi:MULTISPECIES: hypothetical protein [Nitrospirillum]|uniref:Uncharacterized protein n=2 Tax=Nitrospirillum TaxID=1543705 RepID=A0A248JWX1_9PROT|nr:hypothetical protein [Nitrospirillum amazonense]ASG23030.1 hypothetical protein Y958_19375 [Nitrospirillum amazonense CBAmc]MDG3443482.1 hypothetical protein [Nitrospirillum amazonense]MEC4591670.1 hypothetical protein [Nitrospirillum amazonense]TWB22940.1 hypothetical protein FBZ88_11586 [Nitrospirillum amazonense]TWB38751.1 hypothetical protein FBZ91_10679 [Nitrospirillum amazonense]